MEYHVEQTRPIHSTTVALQAAKDALKAMPTHLACDCNQGQVCHVCDPITPPAAAQPAPVQDCFWKREGYKECPAAQRQWVGLTTEEIYACDETSGLPQHEITNADLQAFAYAIEAKLKEKNT
jgi:hypothetical protein